MLNVFNFFQKKFSGTLSNGLNPGMSDLIWVPTVCNGYNKSCHYARKDQVSISMEKLEKKAY